MIDRPIFITAWNQAGVGITQVWDEAPFQQCSARGLGRPCREGLLCPMPGMVRLPGAQLNLVLSFSQGRELICSLVRCWGKAGLQTLAPGEPRPRREHGRAVDKKSLLLPSRAVLLQALTVFIALSKSPRARFRVVQLSLKGKCTVLALLTLLTSWKMRFLSGKEPAGKYSSQSVLSSEPRAKPGTWEAVLGFIGTHHLSKFFLTCSGCL